jgi:hydrogenase nickel incorporation protein HypA/HybF
MHEMSIAQSLVDLVAEQLAPTPEVLVRAVRVRIGELSGVIPEALQSAWPAASRRTIAAGAALRIEPQAVTLWCETCRDERPARSVQSLRCASCGTPSNDVRRGREMELLALEVSE